MAIKQANKTVANKSAKKATVRAKRATAKNDAPKSMPSSGRNPKGGLTKVGREFFAKRDGSHLKPGVTGKVDTPEKMLRKGSFLVRTFTHPRGPMVDGKGEPTRLALSAHAWGEKVPQTVSQAHTLAAKGHTLLAKYHAAQENAGAAKTTSRKADKETSKSRPKKATRKASPQSGSKATAKKRSQ